MTSRNYHLHDGKNGAALAIRVTTRARRNEIVEVLNDGTIKIRLTAPPVEGKANKELVKFLAQVLGIPKSRIDLVAGRTGRDKLVSVLGLDAKTVHDCILESMV